MVQEVDGIATASSRVGLFATVWSNRTTLERPRSQPTGSRAGRSTTKHGVMHAGEGDLEVHVSPAVLAVLRAPTSPSLPRFDDTVAVPINAPQRLEEIIRTAGRALKRLPPATQLSHRTLSTRANLQRVVHDAIQARARLAAGTYNTCTDCSGPISLSSLSKKPWTSRCIYCALSI